MDVLRVAFLHEDDRHEIADVLYSANQPLLNRLALDSGGFAMNLSDADDIPGPSDPSPLDELTGLVPGWDLSALKKDSPVLVKAGN